jgi:hypothetical protein
MTLLRQGKREDAIDKLITWQSEYPHEPTFQQLLHKIFDYMAQSSDMPQTIPQPPAQHLLSVPAGQLQTNKPSVQTGQPVEHSVNVSFLLQGSVYPNSQQLSAIWSPPIPAGLAVSNFNPPSRLQFPDQHLSPSVTLSETPKRKRTITEEDDASESKVVDKKRKLDHLQESRQITLEDEGEVERVADEDQRTLKSVTTGTYNNELSDKMNQAVLHAWNKQLHLFERSVDNQLVSCTDTNGDTILHLLMDTDCRVTYIEVLKKKGADVNAVNHAGETPLHCAARRCKRVFVNKLLNLGAHKAIKNLEGKTPYDVAGNAKIKDLLSRPKKEATT